MPDPLDDRSAAADDVRTVAFVSLGCPKNLVDSERMLGLLASDGLAVTGDEGAADAIVINTCGFLEASKQESLGEIRRALDLKAQGKVKRVVVAGCLVQRHKTRLLAEVPEVDRLVGVFDRDHIVEAVRGRANPRAEHGHYVGKYHDLTERNRRTALPQFEDDTARLRLTPRHYAFLRISEGCNQGCGFCTIPGIRGPMRSKPPEQILAEAEELAADGAVELLLIGQDTTSYGTDIAYAPGLAGLLKFLDRKLPRDVKWARLMYAYPTSFGDDAVRALADADRFVKYLDMPLQHASDRLLNLMKRRVTRARQEGLLDRLRAAMPGLALRTTFIAGSPTETEAEHEELVRFVREQCFEHVGVFPYSAEPGTPMGRMPEQRDDATKQRRVEEIMLAQQAVVFARNADRVGTDVQLMVDAREGRTQRYSARTAGQAPDIDSATFLKSRDPLHPGDVVTARVTDYQNYDLVAEVRAPAAAKRRSLAVVG